jgi:hypothetical protein
LKDGMFLPEPVAGSLEKMAADRAAEALFLKLLERFNAQERYVNDKAGRSFAPALFAKEPEAAKVRKDALAAAMRRLFVANKIHLEPYGYQSRGTFRLVSGAKT